MKTFLKVLGGILVLLVVIIIALNLYFTDERLKDTVMPYVNDAVGRPVQVESMSLTFFSTFPQPGLSVNKMSVPGENESDTLLALDKLVVGVKLFSLFGDEISISEIQLDRPRFIYTIYKDSSSNIDFLMSDEAEEDTTQGYAVNIPYFEITDGYFGYRDLTSNTNVLMNDFDASIALRYSELIESTVDIQLGGLYAMVDGTNYVSDLPLSLTEESTVDMENEVISLQQGTLSIRGLALDLAGSIENWSSTPGVDLTFNSSSDNFGELLRLVPVEYEEYTRGLETRGSLVLNGTVNGPVGGDKVPDFKAHAEVTDGYLKNPDLPQPIEQIQFSADASNSMLTVNRLNAQAGDNVLKARGNLGQPLEDDGAFTLNFTSNVDLATVSDFYDLSTMDIERLGGLLNVQAQAEGNRANPDEAAFNATIRLEKGQLKYNNVPRPIENIDIEADANQDVVLVRNLSLEAASNTFSTRGTINKPLQEENRTVDLNTNLRFELGTIKDFYPIDEDTLNMSGLLTAQVTLEGKADQIERAVKSGTITLNNGFIDYQKLGKPFEDITLESALEGSTLSIATASFKTGENRMNASGLINDYLSDDRTINMKLEGNARLDEISNYYDLKPAIDQLSGDANLNLTAKGSPDNPANMAFDGSLIVKNVNIEGDSLVQPVQNLNGELSLNPKTASLKSLNFRIGSSDVELNGSLSDYMEYLKTKENRKTTPNLTGSYHSEYLNLDELISWDDTTSSPTPIELPDLTSSVTASIDKLVVTGVTMQNLKAKAGTTPDQIQLNNATIELFEGRASGAFVWNVPQPDRTTITFEGSLDNLRAESFFREYPILGKNGSFHEYVTGSFSSKVNYRSELDVYLAPIIETTKMNGNFGMTKFRLNGHPIQNELADLFNAKEFRNAVLDEWNSTFTVDNSILTFKNLRLTSGDIGVEMSGTQHLTRNTISYKTKLYLPGRFKGAIASVITQQAAEALTQDNGTLSVPLQITGTLNSPKISPDQQVIKPAIQNYLKDKAGDALKKLFGGDGNE